MKIGDYWIPTNRLETLLAITKKVYEHFGGDETSADLMANVLKYSPNSGPWGTKMGDLRAYGLIEGRGEKVTVTELGKQATFGEERERDEALRQIVRNVELWRILLDKYGFNVKKENFWVDLVRITGAERLDAQKNEDSIRKAYLEAVEYIKSAGEPIQTPLNEEMENAEAVGGKFSMETQAQSTAGTKKTVGYIGFPEYSRSLIEIKDKRSYNIAKQLLNAIGVALGEEKEESASKEKEPTKVEEAVENEGSLEHKE
jgi:hypothetical protein